MRTRLRALLEWIYAEQYEPEPEPTIMWLPAIDAAGERVRLDMGRYPPDDELAWAHDPDPEMRAAYAIHAVMMARETAEWAGYQLGWDSNAED